MLELRAFDRRELGIESIRIDRRGGSKPATAEREKYLLVRREEPSGLMVGVRRDDGDAGHDVRPLERVACDRRRPKPCSIDLERRHQLRRREMRGERERQAELGGELRAVKARSRIQIGTCELAPGTAFTRCPGAGSRRKAMSSCTSCGKESTFGARLSASAVTWSLRRASKPESMRPGKSASSVPNCSAIRAARDSGH